MCASWLISRFDSFSADSAAATTSSPAWISSEADPLLDQKRLEATCQTQLSTPGKGRQRCCCKGSCASGSAVAPGLGQVQKPSRLCTKARRTSKPRVTSDKYKNHRRHVNPRRLCKVRACPLLSNSDGSLFTSSQALYHVCDLVPHPGPQLLQEQKLPTDPHNYLQGHDVIVPKGRQSAGALGHSAPARCSALPGR